MRPGGGSQPGAELSEADCRASGRGQAAACEAGLALPRLAEDGQQAAGCSHSPERVPGVPLLGVW